MLTLLTRILLFISALWLIRVIVEALFRGTPLRRRSAPGASADGVTAQKMVKDPICGMYMDPRLAIKVQNREGDFFFCSEECRGRFLKNGA